MERLNVSHATKAVADSHRMRHVSMVMSTAQAARIMGNLKPATDSPKQDTNILQGWLKRRVHVMWVSEWVDQARKKKLLVDAKHVICFIYYYFLTVFFKGWIAFEFS